MLQVDEAMLYHEINKLKKKSETDSAQIATKTPEAAETSNAPVVASTTINQSNLYVQEERNILQTLIRYGKMKMVDPSVKNSADEAWIVADFIFEELNQDQLMFSSDLHQLLLKDYENNYKNDDFDAEKFFLYHSNPDIVRLTADLITDKYALSKIHAKVKKIESVADKLHEHVPRVVYEFKNKLLLEMIKTKLLQLKEASETNNSERVDEIMQELSVMEKTKKDLAKQLGERIIIKL
jgi:DNA primase